MFGKKKEKEKEKVIRVCLKGEEVYRGTMTDLPLKEEIILSKSDEQRGAGKAHCRIGGSRGAGELGALELLC